jgi:Transposase, Mutator family
VLLAVVDGLKGFPEAIVAVFPETTVQTCIVHLLRHSLDFVSYKDRKPVAAALKEIYKALDAEAGDWGRKHPAIVQSWRRAWPEVIPFFGFADDVRRIVYTTNSVEALNAKLRRAVRARGHSPNDDAATKLLFLVLSRAEKRVDHAATGVGDRQGPVRRHLRRALHPSDGLMFSRPPPHGIPDSPTVRRQLLQRVAPLRELTQAMLNLPEPHLPTRHPRLAHHHLNAMESRKAAESPRFPEAST